MDEPAIVAALSALAQPTRLRAFRRLANLYPDGLSAGDIARHCAVPHNTMSSHLAALARVGLVSGERRGRGVVYRADVPRFQETVRFLIDECCDGRPESCARPPAADRHSSIRHHGAAANV